MKLIPLTRGYSAKVDDADYDWLMQWKWHATSRSCYAARNSKKGELVKRSLIYMHLSILGIKGPIEGDHRNGDRLDNQRHNLRLAEWPKNRLNLGRHKDNRTGYKGVSKRSDGKYDVRLNLNGIVVFRKGFVDLKEAALAYNAAAIKYHGEFARLNEVR